METYYLETGRALVCIDLTDIRSAHVPSPGRKRRNLSEPLHGIGASWRSDLQSMEIARVRGEMPHIPHAPCPNWIPELQQLRGLSITRGFDKKIREMMGGSLGCTHFTISVIAMAPVPSQEYPPSPRRSQKRIVGPGSQFPARTGRP